ncbi:hypothetical protein [Sunxiuqinia elliptica]|uniref:Uncharacterized protein n=1 Tax=Sunxiuqinia elliptica TaxID=655355 RepID=A0A4R6GNH4_9BACT|nr:hypothetical protein [Sunxiuqinia elliptica]TDN96791.1 hypothetical protein DET52_111161 [Sunxiuqinia elliptica]TDO55650.1 hypothetical protein DET65_4188 [Sunxiuqinia elliptica]
MQEQSKSWKFTNEKRQDEEGSKKPDPIELESCPNNGTSCEDQRAEINNRLITSYEYFTNKQYNQSIDELKFAFEQANQLSEGTCLSCAGLFRLRIMQSLEHIHGELQNRSSGLFRSKQYKPSYEYAHTVIQEFKRQL